MCEIPAADEDPAESGPRPSRDGYAMSNAEPPAAGLPTLQRFLQDQEQWYVGHVLAAVGGDKPRAAAILDVSLATLYRKLDPSQKAPRRRRAAAS